MENTSLTIGGFTQPAVARPIVELPSNVEKGLSSRFLCFFCFFFFSQTLLLQVWNPWACWWWLHQSSHAVGVYSVSVLISYSCHTNILHTSYTNGLTTKVWATTKSSLQCWLVTLPDISCFKSWLGSLYYQCDHSVACSFSQLTSSLPYGQLTISQAFHSPSQIRAQFSVQNSIISRSNCRLYQEWMNFWQVS